MLNMLQIDIKTNVNILALTRLDLSAELFKFISQGVNVAGSEINIVFNSGGMLK